MIKVHADPGNKMKKAVEKHLSKAPSFEPGIYTHNEMEAAYKLGFNDGLKRKKMRSGTIITGKQLETNYLRECVNEWGKLELTEKHEWNDKAKGKDITGFNLFVSKCQFKHEKHRLNKIESRNRFIKVVEKRRKEAKQWLKK